MFVLLQLQMFLSALEKVLLFPYSLVKCSGSSLSSSTGACSL